MAARIFLWIVAILTLLVVGGAFVYHQYGDRILAEQALPKVEFTAPPPEAAPRYEGLEAWWARPDMMESLADWEPEPPAAAAEEEAIDGNLMEEVEAADDETETADADRPIAVFYVHPTTYLKTDRWNADMDLSGMAKTRAELFVKSQASAFAELGEVWAPRYRQASFGTFLSQSANAQKALDVAYGDVREAFDVFLENNPDGPVILAGHSQGGLHTLRLLTDYREQLDGRLVAAYVVGWPIDREADLPATGLNACTGREEQACILSWLSFGDPPNPGLVLREWLDAKGYAGVQRDRDRLVCTNPLNGGAQDDAPPSDNPGLLIPEDGLETAMLQAGSVGARCDRGLLVLDGEIPDLGPYVLPGNNYHAYDYALFWGAVREDVAARYAARTGAEESPEEDGADVASGAATADAA